jgi:transcriptional regulator with XRE-family HTH domain
MDRLAPWASEQDCFPSRAVINASLLAMEIGDRIRRARKAAGLSQRELASAIGVTHGTVGQWESHGKRPTRDNLQKVAKATLTSFDELARGIPNMEGILVQDDRALRMLRRFFLMSTRQQDNLLELLEMAGDVRRDLQEPREASHTEEVTTKDGEVTPR